MPSLPYSGHFLFLCLNFSIQSFFIIFYRKDSFCIRKQRKDYTHTVHQLSGILQHPSVICRNIRFTLCTVRNNIFYLFRFFRRKLYPRRKKPAPPIPTIPASPILSMISSLVISPKRFHRKIVYFRVFSIIFNDDTFCFLVPAGLNRYSIPFTVPIQKHGSVMTQKPPASAIFCPFENHDLLFLTIGFAGAPICCESGYASSPFGSNVRISLSFRKSAFRHPDGYRL